MPRLFVSENNIINGDQVRLEDDDAHYLAQVLRLKTGDKFEIIVPTASEYIIVVERITGDCVEGRIVGSRQRNAEPALTLTMYVAILKGKDFSLVIQKAVELGVGAIVPLITRRTVVRLSRNGAGKRRERWQHIAEEAVRQSERMNIPEVEPPMAFDRALEHWRTEDSPGIIFTARATGSASCNLRRILSQLQGTDRLAVFVGPEGGFTAQEINAGLRAGLHEASLGPRILRAETAALLVCGLCMYELDELTSPNKAEARGER